MTRDTQVERGRPAWAPEQPVRESEQRSRLKYFGFPNRNGFLWKCFPAPAGGEDAYHSTPHWLPLPVISVITNFRPDTGEPSLNFLK